LHALRGTTAGLARILALGQRFEEHKVSFSKDDLEGLFMDVNFPTFDGAIGPSSLHKESALVEYPGNSVC
jgi:hypothetical protein